MENLLLPTKSGGTRCNRIDPIKELFTIYTHFHKEAEKILLWMKKLEAFNKLENGDKEYIKLWQWFRTVSLDAFQVLYDQLSVSFDHIQGESF